MLSGTEERSKPLGSRRVIFNLCFFATENWQSIDGSCQTAVGELDNNPVSRAIARHLGIDISPEGRAARNRRGIVIIVHGAPLTGTQTVPFQKDHFLTTRRQDEGVEMKAVIHFLYFLIVFFRQLGAVWKFGLPAGDSRAKDGVMTSPSLRSNVRPLSPVLFSHLYYISITPLMLI